MIPPKVYIASPFFTPDQLELVRFVESVLDKMGIYFFSPRSGDILQEMESDAARVLASQTIYLSNVFNMIDCNIMIAILDFKDTGTTYELGYAASYREQVNNSQRIFTVNFSGKGLNVMLRQCTDGHCSDEQTFRSLCASLRDGVKIVRTLDTGEIE